MKVFRLLEGLKKNGVPLWLWIGLRMSILAISAVIAIAVSMWFYLNEKDKATQLSLPENVRIELGKLVKHPHENQRLIWEILQNHFDIEIFLPGLPSDDWWMLVKMVLVSMPIVVISGLLSARSISRQITVLGSAVRKVRDGDFSVNIQPPSNAPMELSELTENFNDMGAKLAQYEREVRESSAMLAHELRTPLNAAMGRMQGMIDEVFPLDMEQIRKVCLQLEQINRLVGDLHLVSLARAGQLVLECEEYSLNELVTERIEWAAPQLEGANISTHVSLDSKIELVGDRDRLGQAITILIDNVARYAADGKLLEASAVVEDNVARISIADRGPGVDGAHLPRVMDRFWRADDSRSRNLGGSGLGLAIAAAICQGHGGSLECRNRRSGGLKVTLVVPLIAHDSKSSPVR